MSFFAVWTGQALWVWVTLLPVLVLNANKHNAGFRWTDVVGAVIWAAGFACELTADLQKQKWRSDPANKGRFISVGVKHSPPSTSTQSSCVCSQIWATLVTVIDPLWVGTIRPQIS